MDDLLEHDSVRSLSPHPHVHSPEALEALIKRLSRAEGHVRGIQEMIKNNRSCPDVLVQLAAVRGAINRVARIILYDHLSHCVQQAAKAGELESEIAALKQTLKTFLD